jgi:hypothetical protein
MPLSSWLANRGDELSFWADLGEGEITLGELRASTVHAAKDVYHNVDGLVGPP